VAGRTCLERAAAIHCTADAELEQARTWIGMARGEVIPNVLDLGPYEQAPGPEEAFARWPELRDASFNVLFLSRIHETKGVEHLLEAVARAAPRIPGLRLVIAGGGRAAYLESLRRIVGAAGLAERTTWTGIVDGPLKRSLYAAADLLALPTSQENFGFVLFECLAAGTPVVTTDLVDTRNELLRSGGATIVPQSAEAFAAEIEAFATRRRDAAAMGAAGRDWIMRELAPDQVAGRFEALYRDCGVPESRSSGRPAHVRRP